MKRNRSSVGCEKEPNPIRMGSFSKSIEGCMLCFFSRKDAKFEKAQRESHAQLQTSRLCVKLFTEIETLYLYNKRE